jgi:hypothetical protein
VPKSRTRDKWELAAEKLVSDVEWLLKHRQTIVDALAESPGMEETESKLREIHALSVALKIEISHAATGHDRTAVGTIAWLLKKTAKPVGYTMLTTATALAVTEVHDALLAVDTQADQVIECVIESEEEEIIDAGDGSATDIIDTGDAYLEVPRHAGPFLRRLMQYGG